MPVEYSPVMTIAPRMPATSIVNCVGESTALTAGNPPPKAEDADAIIIEMPIDSTAVMPSDHHVERRVVILIHSLWSRWTKLRRGGEEVPEPASARVAGARAVMRSPWRCTRRRRRSGRGRRLPATRCGR
ncbi:hypothetical protein D3C87_1832780 [compost metagenome]